MPDTKRTTVYLDTVTYRALQALARRQGRPAAHLVREALAEYATRHAGAARPRSLGAGRSGRKDLSDRAEDLLSGLGQE